MVGIDSNGIALGSELHNIAVVAQICSTNSTYSYLIGCFRIKGIDCVSGFFDAVLDGIPIILIGDAILNRVVFISYSSCPSERSTVDSLAVCSQSQIGWFRTILEGGEGPLVGTPIAHAVLVTAVSAYVCVVSSGCCKACDCGGIACHIRRRGYGVGIEIRISAVGNQPLGL